MNEYIIGNKNKIKKEIQSQEFLDKAIYLLKNIDKVDSVEVINSIADFLQRNYQYQNMKSFEETVDKLVNIIEDFNANKEVKGDKIKSLALSLEELSGNLKKQNEIKLFFYGKDKYHMLDKVLNLNISFIEDINKYIRKVESKDEFSSYILVVSEETTSTELDYKTYFDCIVYYDKLMNYLFDIGEKIYYSNYDYYYLSNELGKSKEKDVDTIIVGNSYPLTGIKAELLKSKAINLSLSSQDLYYSFQLAKKAISNNTKIKRCIIGSGYYLVNHDLSRSKSEDAINRVKNVYYPILNDKHNSDKVDVVPIETINDILKDSMIRLIFDLNYLDQYFKSLIHISNKSYFNSTFTREMNSMLRGVKLRNISDEEKWKLGQLRANQHNKLTKYTKTTEEYNKIFNEFINFLSENGVTPIVVIFPSTQYYSNFLNEQYAKEFYNIIDCLESKCKTKIIDFSKKDIFVEDDFIDFDHMGDSGAKKITVELNKVIYKY
ncbi:MAG: hypothetical protein E6344_16400 [Clostridium sp.]|nr:hypothetical protein [Clostridium sp.]MDU7085272.1 hypothetical protein [Clostridium sp.]